MKLVRVMDGERAVIGALTESGVVDLARALNRYIVSEPRIDFLEPLFSASLSDSRALLAAWPVVGSYFSAAVGADQGDATLVASLEETRTLPFVPNPGKIIGLGYNYKTLCKTEGVEPSEHPQLFAKMPTSVIGPFDDVIVPEAVTKLDFEAELCVVVGRTASVLTVPRLVAS